MLLKVAPLKVKRELKGARAQYWNTYKFGVFPLPGIG
jgi:hypothetical protein